MMTNMLATLLEVYYDSMALSDVICNFLIGTTIVPENHKEALMPKISKLYNLFEPMINNSWKDEKYNNDHVNSDYYKIICNDEITWEEKAKIFRTDKCLIDMDSL